MRRRALGRLLACGAVPILVLTAACGAADDPEPRLAELDLEPVATLVVDDDGFAPTRLEVPAGEGITLVNEGDDVHSFVAADPYRDTGELLPGEEVLLRFDEEDEVEAHDGTDPEQTVTIVVVEPTGG